MCHLPPGTASNDPSPSIAETATTGPTVCGTLDTNAYPTGVKVSDQEMERLRFRSYAFDGDGSYTTHPSAPSDCDAYFVTEPNRYHLVSFVHFDFANNYGTPPGSSELVCGDIIRRELPRDELIIASKAGYRMWPGPYGEWLGKKYLVASCDQSLQRMGLDYFDIFYLHRPDPTTPLDESLGALDLLIRQGKVLYGGVSSFRGAHFADAVRTSERHDWAPITIHQPAYNLLNRGIEQDLLPHTERAGTGVIAFVPLASGLLTDKYLSGDIPPDSRAALRWGEEQAKRRLTPERLATLRSLHELAKRRGQSLAQMALAWILRLPGVTSALIGASKVEQIEENVKALEHPDFSQEELAEIDKLTA